MLLCCPYTVLCFIYLILYCRQSLWAPINPHTLLLSACLHFMSLKMKFIYSIITHFSKLFPHCQRNLLPSALMAAQLWMVDGYLIGETTSHWAQEGEKAEKKKGMDKKQGQKITSPVYFVPIHWQILDSVEKCFHLRDQSCNYFQSLMSTSLPSLPASGFRPNKTSACAVQREAREVITCCRRQAVLIS